MIRCSASPRWARLGITGARLDAPQCVKGDCEGHVEAVFQFVSRHAAQPVVRVDGVNRSANEVLADMVGKRGNHCRQVVLVERGSASIDMGDAHPRLHFHFIGLRRVGAPGVDVTLDTEMRQRRSEFTHVDVQTAAIAAAGLVQRRGVHAQHRNRRDTAGLAARRPAWAVVFGEPSRPVPGVIGCGGSHGR